MTDKIQQIVFPNRQDLQAAAIAKLATIAAACPTPISKDIQDVFMSAFIFGATWCRLSAQIVEIDDVPAGTIQ